MYRLVIYDWTVCKLQVCKSILIEFAPPEWQNDFHIKCQKLVMFANGCILQVYENGPIARREFKSLGNSSNTVTTVRQKDESGPHGPHRLPTLEQTN